MRILHIWDQAGVASVIAKWQAKSGHKTHVIKNIKHDKMKITFYYRGELVRNKYVFVIKSLLAIRNYDLIHLHDAWFIVPFAKIMYPKKKFVMHYHGSLVRMNPIKKRAQWEKKVDAIIVATPDLLDYQYAKKPTYVPNPIDTDLFKKTKIPNCGYGFTSLKWDQTPETVRDFLKTLPYNFELHIREQTRVIEYSSLPSFLCTYEYFVDYPTYKNKVIKANSCLGLQAMSMGLKVISHDGLIRTELPYEHTPEAAVKNIDKVYDEIIPKTLIKIE